MYRDKDDRPRRLSLFSGLNQRSAVGESAANPLPAVALSSHTLRVGTSRRQAGLGRRQRWRRGGARGAWPSTRRLARGGVARRGNHHGRRPATGRHVRRGACERSAIGERADDAGGRHLLLASSTGVWAQAIASARAPGQTSRGGPFPICHARSAFPLAPLLTARARRRRCAGIPPTCSRATSAPCAGCRWARVPSSRAFHRCTPLLYRRGPRVTPLDSRRAAGAAGLGRCRAHIREKRPGCCANPLSRGMRANDLGPDANARPAPWLCLRSG